MNTLIFRTNITTQREFLQVKSVLKKRFAVKDSTIDLGDRDRILRVITENGTPQKISCEINKLNYFCEELED